LDGVKRPFIFAVVLTFVTLPLQCATLERLTLDDMIAKSPVIERATVVSSYAAAEGSLIFTHYRLQVTERYKGVAVSEIVVPGGTANNVKQFVAGAPQFQPGDEFVFFLWTSKSGLTWVTGLTQGLFTVPPGGDSDPVLSRAASHELMLDRTTGHAVQDQTLTMKLSDLRTRIARGAAQ